jgi:hypothetical protein
VRPGRQILNPLTRRELLQVGSTAAIALALRPPASGREEESEPYFTCFYQFGKAALEALSGPGGLPDGRGYLHVFSHSHPGSNPHPDAAVAVRARGSSYRYALAFDAHKYPGWMAASEEQLKAWTSEFRDKALDARGPADYFAFNEMPTTGASKPALRGQVARLLRLLHAAGGGRRLRGVFYFTERNLNPQNWEGDADDFWAAVDETCDLVVGEHYHSYEFAFSRSVAQLSDHLSTLPKWLKASGKPAQQSIAERKYAVIHSSFYGPALRGWAGVESGKHDPADLMKYFQHLIAATRQSPFGRRRIAFGPLATTALDPRTAGILAEALGKDARTR